MSKSYSLEIENVGEDDYIIMSRGHHDPHEFIHKVREESYDWPLGKEETDTGVPSQLINIDARVRVSSLSSLGLRVEVTRDKEAVHNGRFDPSLASLSSPCHGEPFGPSEVTEISYQ